MKKEIAIICPECNSTDIQVDYVKSDSLHEGYSCELNDCYCTECGSMFIHEYEVYLNGSVEFSPF